MSYPHRITLPLHADYEWLDADHQSYVRDFEQEQSNGNIDPEEVPDEFRVWLAIQPVQYLLAHGIVVHG